MRLREIFEAEGRAVAHRPFTGAKDDRYFMRQDVAAGLADWIKSQIKQHGLNVTRVEDPCAGSGEITCHFPGASAFDLNPEPNEFGVNVQQRDFLQHDQDHEPGLLMLMNVPYGKQSATATRFFNRAAKYADYLAVVVPQTWERLTIHPRLNKNFHLVASYKIPKNAFYLPDNNNKIHDVPSVGQLWVRRDDERQDQQRVRSSEYIETAQNKGKALARTPDVAIVRAGASAGTVITSGFTKYPQEGLLYVFIKKDKPLVLRAINSIDWRGPAATTMAQNSLDSTTVHNQVTSWVNAHKNHR